MNKWHLITSNANFTVNFDGNIRSLRNKVDYISNIIEDYDIAFFTETHLDKLVLDKNIHFSGYDIPVRKDRNSDGGGMARIQFHIPSDYKRINNNQTKWHCRKIRPEHSLPCFDKLKKSKNDLFLVHIVCNVFNTVWFFCTFHDLP
jgi:hypothetical protein